MKFWTPHEEFRFFRFFPLFWHISPENIPIGNKFINFKSKSSLSTFLKLCNDILTNSVAFIVSEIYNFQFCQENMEKYVILTSKWRHYDVINGQIWIFLQICKSSVAIFILGKFHQIIFIFKDFRGVGQICPPSPLVRIGVSQTLVRIGLKACYLSIFGAQNQND